MSQVLNEIGLTLNRRLKLEEAQAARENAPPKPEN